MRLGRREAAQLPLPPQRMRYMGENDEVFIALGDALADDLELETSLTRDSSVLDVGCGYGRLAHALLRRGFRGRYLGFDAIRRPIRWCRRHLGRPGMEFRRLDIYNERYNARGSLRADQVELDEEPFDVAAVFSVFTHLWPEDVAAYMRLLGSALRPGGRAVATFFLIDDEWRQLDGAGETRIGLPFERAPFCRYHSEEEPLHRVGYELEWVVETARECELIARLPPRYGTWSGRSVDRSASPGYQDSLVFERG